MHGRIPSPAPAAVKVFERQTPSRPGIVVRKVFGQPAAFVNGNMFMGVFGDKVFVRLSEEVCQDAAERHGLELFEPMPGRPMRGYDVLHPEILAGRDAGRNWVAKSLAFSERLPAKTAKSKGS